jgi:GTP-binding protein
MNIDADFVISAASARDLPQDGLAEVALIGRSNVGKSSLINSLTRRRLARTSAAPGKTRLANVYRVRRGTGAPLYLVDLPGYGYARGGDASAREFAELTRAYFGDRLRSRPEARQSRGDGSAAARGRGEAPPPGEDNPVAALVLVDARHPGLAADREAWEWVRASVPRRAVVATKIDKLARGPRIRAMRELESAFDETVLPFSAVTGEGLDELWKLIDRLVSSLNPNRRSSPPRKATAARPRRR